MTVERHELRNRNTTSTVSSGALDQRLLDVARPSRATRIAGVAHDVAASRPSGSVLWISSTCARIASATCGRAVALRLLDVDADRLLAVEERRRARLLGAVRAVGDVAEADERAACDCATTSCAKSSGVSSRPRRRIVARRARRSTRPTGAARFCACSACTTCATLTPGGLQRRRPQLDGQLALDAADHVDLAPRRGCRAAARVMLGIGEPRQLGAGEPLSTTAPAT